MNIIHIAPTSPYNDYWGYQDNLLPKYHAKLGHTVTLIVTTKMHKDGKVVKTNPSDYVLADGVRVIRLEYKKSLISKLSNFFSHLPVYNLLNEIKPDLIFYHGLVSNTILDVIKYKQENNNCIIVQDNHQDYNNSNSRRTKITNCYYKLVNKISVKYVDKVYGVTPWRKQYAEEVFDIPKSKTDVLILGADDEALDLKNRAIIREKIRNLYKIKKDDYLIVTGGKLDKKKKVDVLINSIKDKNNVKLLIFGSVSKEFEKEFNDLVNKYPDIIYIGWVDSSKVYDYFFAADLVYFGGGHSALWEQACASKTPCVFNNWHGIEHLNNGGNSIFVNGSNIDEISKTIDNLLFTDEYNKMKTVAESTATDVYLYSNVAKKSLECLSSKR